VYGTPSGRIELSSSLLARWGLDAVPSYKPPSVFARNTENFPFVLTTGGRDLRGFHQNAQQMDAYRQRHPDPEATVHPEAAGQAGVREGDWIEIATPIGAVRQRAKVSDALPPNVVHADRWWYPERADDPSDPFGFWATNINVCTDDATESCDPVMGSWLLRALPCRISRADDQADGTPAHERQPRFDAGTTPPVTCRQPDEQKPSGPFKP
jgi:anaerobic selenocysteine-containing dehydrogenase